MPAISISRIPSKSTAPPSRRISDSLHGFWLHFAKFNAAGIPTEATDESASPAYEEFCRASNAIYENVPQSLDETAAMLEVILYRDRDNIQKPILMALDNLFAGLRLIQTAPKQN